MTPIDQLSAAKTKDFLAYVETQVGKPPRSRTSRALAEARVRRPAGMPDTDEVLRILSRRNEMVLLGDVRWACVVHANVYGFMPGIADIGAQIVYAPAGDVPLGELRHIASRVVGLKFSGPTDPAEKRMAEMLIDEWERALDWPIPPGLTDGRDVVTTVVLMQRIHLPGRVLARSYFPIFADRETKYATFVPAKFWPAALRRDWQESVEAALDDLTATSRPIRLTSQAAMKLREIFKEPELRNARVHVAAIRRGDLYAPTMKFTLDPPDRSNQLSYEYDGVSITIDLIDIVTMNGTVIDYRRGAGEAGFEFLKPGAEE